MTTMMNHDDHNGEEEEALIRILATEIALDGGISYVSSLLQHCHDSSVSSSSSSSPAGVVSAARVRQRIRRHAQTRLLGGSSSDSFRNNKNDESPDDEPNKGTTRQVANGSGGMTWFLSQYPRIFSLTTTTSHQTKKNNAVLIVRLLDMDISSTNNKTSLEDHETSNEEGQQQQQQQGEPLASESRAAVVLLDRVTFLLRQRSCKLARCCRHHSNENHGITTIPPANLKWLATKAVLELHAYVRQLGPSRRPTGHLMKRQGWWNQVMPLFVDFLKRQPHDAKQPYTLMMFESSNDDHSTHKHDHHDNDDKEGYSHMTIRLLIDEEDANNELLGSREEIAARVQRVLLGGPHVGGMDLGMLQQDPKLRSLLGGRDLPSIIRMTQDESQSSCCQEGRKNPFDRIQLIQDRIFYSHETGVGTTTIMSKEGWLGMDEEDDVGLFSVTARSSASAMANCLHQTVSSLSFAKNDDTASMMVGIDLTAGVGGNTVALCKHFTTVVAIELDAQRANRLQQNLLDRGHDRVEVHCGDTLKFLPELSRRYRPRQHDPHDVHVEHGVMDIAAILDPPWGGLDYRQQQQRRCDTYYDEDLGLGTDVPLSKVVARVSQHLKPCVLGIKLPPTFPVPGLTDKLSSLQINFQVSSIKKFKRQLFITLHLR